MDAPSIDHVLPCHKPPAGASADPPGLRGVSRLRPGWHTVAVSTLERWHTEAGERGVARLDIPPHASRERHFEVDVRFVVRAGAGKSPRHGLKVLVNGAMAWAREVPTPGEGEDSLEWRARVVIPIGEALKLQAVSELQQAFRLKLQITAEEV